MQNKTLFCHQAISRFTTIQRANLNHNWWNNAIRSHDKAGITEIVTAMESLIKNPDIKHGKIRVGFNLMKKLVERTTLM
jgi:di/tripeptidase